MPTSNIQVVEIGIPGPPGAGVSAAEKATYVTLSGTNTFTATQTIAPSSGTTSLAVRNSSGQSIFLVQRAASSIWTAFGATQRGFSDSGSTETWSIDGATGNAQFDGTVTTSRIVGDAVTLTLPIIDGGGSAISTGIKADFVVPYNCTVTGWTMLADVSGSISIELWMDTYANYPPTVADLITGTTGTNNPRISSSTKNTSTTLTGWTTSLVKDRIIRMNVASAATITRATLALSVTRA